MDRAGIKRQHRSHGFHIFRHSAGSLVNALTGDLKLVQQLLAHPDFDDGRYLFLEVFAPSGKARRRAVAAARKMGP